MGLEAGKLDRRLRVEAAGAADDGFNMVEAWRELTTVWAQFLPQRGQEAREQLGREAQLLATFRIRWSSTTGPITPGGHRLRFPAAPDGQVWDIKSAVEIGRREGIEIVAVARQGATQ